MERDLAYLVDILNAGRRILLKTQGILWEQFSRDEDLQDIVFRRLMIMGEASNKISEAFKELHPEIPWYKIYGMRNRLIHDYRNVDHDEVWKTVRQGFTDLLRQIEPLVPPDTHD
jgi:uncharacterized protein with HEPN domain